MKILRKYGGLGFTACEYCAVPERDGNDFILNGEKSKLRVAIHYS